MNVEFAKRLAKRLRSIRPDEYEQGTYAMRTDCGTACCIAGHAVLEGGGEFAFSEQLQVRITSFCRIGATKKLICYVAGDMFGINTPAAEKLFSGMPWLDWDEEFGDRWSDAMNGYTKERLQDIAADYLEYLCSEES